MVKNITFLLLFVSITLFALNVKVGIYNNPPQVYLEGDKPKGLYIEIIENVAKKNNWQIEYVYDDFSNLLDKLKAGEIDVMTSIAYTPARAELFEFNRQALLLNWGVVCSKESITGLLQINQKRVATVKNDVYAGFLRKNLEDFHLNNEWFELSDYDEVLSYVNEGKADIGVVSRIFAVSNISKYNLKIGTLAFSPIELRFAFPKQSPKTSVVIEQIDSYLDVLKNDEKSYNELLGRYLGTTVEKRVIPVWVFWGIGVLLIFGIIVLLWDFTLESAVKKRTEQLNEALEELRAKNEELEDAYSEIETKTSELEAVNQELTATNEELTSQSVEIMKMNETLERLYIQLEEMIQRFTESLERLTNIVFVDEEQLESEIRSIVDKVLGTLEVRLLNEKESESFVENALAELKVPINEDLSLFGLKSNDLRPSEIKFMKVLGENLKVLLKIREYIQEREEFNERIINVLLEALSLHESYTADHARRLEDLAVILGKRLGLSSERLEFLKWASILHDIGKLAVDKEILNKPTKLTPEEYEKVKIHPVVGAKLLQIAGFKEIAKIVRHHHERYDGKGYPDGLKSEEIPLESRIICIVDSLDAMTSNRPYRPALSTEEAIEEIIRNKGTQFDPAIAEVFVQIIREGIIF